MVKREGIAICERQLMLGFACCQQQKQTMPGSKKMGEKEF
jgi:hypothetical protein